MRQVIFIAGTAYSGSSMLDMMLGSSDSSFSVGEVRALFYPNKKYHINPPCGCGDSDCNIWETLNKSGWKSLYTELFRMFKNIETIIDSSKNCFWIAKQQKRLNKLGIKSGVLLIWKNPEEYALSRLKRGQLKNWEYAWLNYHKLLFSLTVNTRIRSISYRDLALNPEEKLKQVCMAFNLKFNPNMLTFWEKKHHILFGNTSAKYHMYDKDNNQFIKSVNNLSMKEMQLDNEKSMLNLRHRSIYYKDELKKKLPDKILAPIAKNNSFIKTIDLLKSMDVQFENDIKNRELVLNRLSYSRLRLIFLTIRNYAKYRYFYLKNRKEINGNLDTN